MLKCKNWAKESHDDFAFNHASGIIGGYAFFYFIIFGALSLVVPDGEKFLGHEFYYESNAFSILAIESFYMIGVLFSVTNTFFLIKYEPSNSLILGILNIAQQTYLYTINILFILDFNSFYIANLVIFSAFNIATGLYMWKTYYKDEVPENDSNNSNINLLSSGNEVKV